MVNDMVNKNMISMSKKNKNVHPLAHSMNMVSIDVNQLYQDFQRCNFKVMIIAPLR